MADESKSSFSVFGLDVGTLEGGGGGGGGGVAI
jgi:hypothetical protein